jgi:hypothetical protein
MWSIAAASVTCSVALPVISPTVAVTVCVPSRLAVQVAPLQDPSGSSIVKVVK